MDNAPEQCSSRFNRTTLACPRTQVAELEEFLFGSKTADARAVFAKRVEPESDDDLTLTDLLVRTGKR